jgi:hypothetical protein
MTELENWVGTTEAAQASGWSVQHICRMAKQGTIQARRIGRTWAIHLPSLLEYKAEMDATGTSKHDARRNPDWQRSPDAGRQRRERDGDV